MLKEINKSEKKATRKNVLTWLQNQRVSSLFRPRVKVFARRKMSKLRPNRIWSSDLFFLPALASFNYGKSVFLTVIDNFSSYAFVRVLKDKSKSSMIQGFQSILEEAGTACVYLHTDRGSEYTALKDLFREHHIKNYNTTTGQKAFKSERYQKSLQIAIFKYMVANNTKKFIDKLQDLVYAYNHRPSRVLYGHTPAQAYKNPDTIAFLKKKFKEEKENYDQAHSKPPKFAVGDWVRAPLDYGTFHRGYEVNFEDQVRKIIRVTKTSPPMYELEGKKRKYYAKELSAAAETEQTRLW